MAIEEFLRLAKFVQRQRLLNAVHVGCIRSLPGD